MNVRKRILAEILRRHELWLRAKKGGECADLRNADLKCANLIRASFTGANLEKANLFGANLISANLTGANLEYAIISGANLEKASLVNANLNGAKFVDANLRKANLSGASGIPSQWEFIRDNFESTADGIIAYKTFGMHCLLNGKLKLVL